jgi:acylaminoacyl-peptidase
MKLTHLATLLLTLAIPALGAETHSTDQSRFNLADIFELEWAADPQISPDGERVAYVRYFMDVMTDRRMSNIWTVDFDGGNHRPLTSGNNMNTSPRWSPSGDRLLWVSSEDGSPQLHMRWMDTGATAKVTNLTTSPGALSWSPDGKWIALTLRVPESKAPMAEMPPKPNEGGSPRQLTDGSFNHQGTPEWTPDGKHLLISSNRSAEWEYEPLESEVYEVGVADGSTRTLPDPRGPDNEPRVSPDGSKIAYVGFDDRLMGFHVTRLHVMDRDGSNPRVVTADLDRSASSPTWAADGKGLFFAFSDEGNGKVAYASLDGQVKVLADDLGNSIGRPYSGGSFSVSPQGRFAFTTSPPERPADVAVGQRGTEGSRRVTDLNGDLLDHKELAAVEEIWVESSFDGRRVQGWVAKPPGFDPAKKYPLVLEIHGGPFANYGDRFSGEVQLFASAGYVVLYMNPRGSTSYGDEFANLIHHNYPSQDYDDLMTGVDALIARGYVDEEQLFVTGGSGGGVLTAWIVGKTDRFAGAVVAKPVINWYSFALTADFYNLFYKYWFSGFPWDVPEEYLERSPLSYVGNVSTPTMLLTGELDYRTPMSESEQFYQALKLRKIDTALVRIPGASHGIAQRPSQLVAKIAHILAWFERYRTDGEEAAED